MERSVHMFAEETNGRWAVWLDSSRENVFVADTKNDAIALLICHYGSEVLDSIDSTIDAALGAVSGASKTIGQSRPKRSSNESGMSHS